MEATYSLLALRSGYGETALVAAGYISFAGLEMIDLGWVDATQDLDEGAPFTLVKNDGIGSLQFSVAKYAGGVRPDADAAMLQKLLEDFSRTRKLGPIVNLRVAMNSVSGDFPKPDEFVRVWYVSDGLNFALVTYVVLEVQKSRVTSELSEAESIVRSIRFPAA